METSSLEKLGLNKAEIDVYLALLKNGSSTASFVSDKTNLNRTHIYDTLKRLIEKGLVSSHELNQIKYFSASSPDRITDYLQDVQKEVEKLLPELKRIKESKPEETKVKLFQGKDGIKTILKDILHEKKDYDVFGEEAQFQDLFPIYIQQFLRDVKHNNMKERLLTRHGINLIKASPSSQIKYLEEKFFSPTTTVVYGNKVATFIWGALCATLIEDKSVADSFRNYFEALWGLAKK